MQIKVRRKYYIVFMLFLIGVLSIFVFHSMTLRVESDTDGFGRSPSFDEFSPYEDSENERARRWR
ncbi:MAG: hypothetical protein NVSMB9_29630 [Isosphaeraceae bacterium]